MLLARVWVILKVWILYTSNVWLTMNHRLKAWIVRIMWLARIYDWRSIASVVRIMWLAKIHYGKMLNKTSTYVKRDFYWLEYKVIMIIGFSNSTLVFIAYSMTHRSFISRKNILSTWPVLKGDVFVQLKLCDITEESFRKVSWVCFLKKFIN